MTLVLHYVIVLSVIAFAGTELALGHLDAPTAVGLVATAAGFSIGVTSQSPNVGNPGTGTKPT
jgi:hypothetical protein